MTATVKILAAVQDEQVERYQNQLSAHDDFNVQVVSRTADAVHILADQDQHVDLFVIDNDLGDVHQLVGELRQTYPRLMVILVDEEADFGMPGQADDISTEPFRNDDLAQRIRKMMSDRRMETLRSDSLPAVRSIAKQLRTAKGALGKKEAALHVCLGMNFDYAGYYQLSDTAPGRLELQAQAGPAAIQAIAPEKAGSGDLMHWVAQNGQSRIAGPDDDPNHPLVRRGRLGAVACVPVEFSGTSYGVLIACRDRPSSITQENVLMLELICAQLAAALGKEKTA